jgi:hypothetical protein
VIDIPYVIYHFAGLIKIYLAYESKIKFEYVREIKFEFFMEKIAKIHGY